MSKERWMWIFLQSNSNESSHLVPRGQNPWGVLPLTPSVERHQPALQAFIFDCDRFLDCRTLPCSTWIFVCARIWNLTKHRVV
jgi:hypothetical protein